MQSCEDGVCGACYLCSFLFLYENESFSMNCWKERHNPCVSKLARPRCIEYTTLYNSNTKIFETFLNILFFCQSLASDMQISTIRAIMKLKQIKMQFFKNEVTKYLK